jgi:hypothetical protein
MSLADDLSRAASDALTAGVNAARGEGVALAADFRNLLEPNLLDIVGRIADIAAARIAGTITTDLARLDLRLQFESIEDLAVAEANLVLLAVQNILNAVINALKAVINTATTHSLGFALV